MSREIQLGERVRYKIGSGHADGMVINRFPREYPGGFTVTIVTIRTVNGYAINRPLASVERVRALPSTTAKSKENELAQEASEQQRTA